MPLSSHAALKTVNERGFQQNEKDEEFGVDLSYFHARMYDASLGRFMGIDPKADQQSPLNPYHYGANNPVMMRDPDGRLFFMAALFVGKLILKKATVLKIAKLSAKTVKLIKGLASATTNIMANRKQIAKAAKEGNFLSGLGMAFGYGAVGFAGNMLGSTGFESFMIGGFLNTKFEMATGAIGGEGQNILGRMAGSFLSGGFSALSGKAFGDGLDKGSLLANKKHGMMTEGLAGGEKLFAKKNLLKYGMSGAQNLGDALNKNDGHLTWKKAALHFGAGVGGALTATAGGKWLSKGVPNLFNNTKFSYDLASYVAPLLSATAAVGVQNTLDYYATYNQFPKNLKTVYSDGLKFLYKLDFYLGANFWGYEFSNQGYRAFDAGRLR